MVRWLERIRVSPPVSATLIVLLFLGLLGAGGYFLAGPVKSWIRDVPKTMASARGKIDKLRKPIKQVSQAVEKAQQEVTGDGKSKAQPQTPASSGPAIPSFLGRVFATTTGILSTLLQTLEATREADGVYAVDATELPFGTYTAQASQLDGAANVGTSTANTFTIVDGPTGPPPPPPPPPSPVLVGAGDIASCGVSGQDEATAAIIEGLPNATVFTLGDNAYPMGRAEDYACYDASWGRFKNRTKPVIGGHDVAKDPGRVRETVVATGLHDGLGRSPYEGMTVDGKVRLTVLAGRVIVREGALVAGAGGGRFVGPDRAR